MITGLFEAFGEFLKKLKIYIWVITLVITVATVVYAVYNTITNTPKDVLKLDAALKSLDTRTTLLEMNTQVQRAEFVDLKQQVVVGNKEIKDQLSDSNKEIRTQLNIINADIKDILKKM